MGSYSFSAAAGQNVILNWAGSTYTNAGTQIAVISQASQQIVPGSGAPPFTANISASPSWAMPAQVGVATLGAGATSGTLVLNNLPATGQYIVYVLPASTDAGTIQLSYSFSGTTPPTSGPFQGSLIVDGPPLGVTIPAYATYNYSFFGTQGQAVTFIQSNLSAQDHASVRGPTSAALVLGQQFNPPYAGAYPAILPATGTYFVQIQAGSTTTTASLQIVSMVVQTVLPNGANVVLANPPPGGGRVLTFNATAGQTGSLTWQASTCPGNLFSYALHTPTGRVLFTGTTIASLGQENAFQLNNLQESGVYYFTGGCTGSPDGITIGLRLNTTGTLAVNGAFIPVTLLDGQSGSYKFFGTAGQSIQLGISSAGNITSPAAPYFCLYDPDGVTLTSTGAGQYNCQTLPASGGGFNLPVLPTTGTYRLFIGSPAGATSFSLGLSTSVTGVITPGGGPTTVLITRPGQWAFLTMPGTGIGNDETLVVTNSTFGFSTLNVYAPFGNGAAWAGMQFYAGNRGLKLPGQVGTGTYSVALAPNGAATGSFSIQAIPDLTPVLPGNGAPLNLSLALGQNANIRFNATAGQNVSIVWSNLAASYVGQLLFDIFPPTGGLFYRMFGYNSVWQSNIPSSGVMNLGQVPETGTYTLRISNGYENFNPQTAFVTLQLF